MDFVIYRETWRRGGSDNGMQEMYGLTALLNNQNMMCCLGQIGHQCGLALDQLRYSTLANMALTGVGSEHWRTLFLLGLIRMPRRGDLFAPMSADSHTDLARRAMTINDSAEVSEQEREEQLTCMFACYGHKLTFVDGVAPWFEYRLPDPVMMAVAAEIEQLPEPAVDEYDEELVGV